MKINIKNNSTASVNKISAIKEFIKFCQENSPLNREIEVIFVDSSNEPEIDLKYFIPLRNIRVMDCYKKISEKWVQEFSKQRKIQCGDTESKLLVEFFIKKYPHLKFVI
jgi:hypothetical protein